MPSPTSSTRPTSRVSSLERYCSISVCNTETISLALNLMTASRDYLRADIFQLGSNGTVVEHVADAHGQAAQHRRIHDVFQNRLQVKLLTKTLGQAIFLVRRQSHRGANHHPHTSRALVVQLTVGSTDRPEQVQPIVVVQDHEK